MPKILTRPNPLHPNTRLHSYLQSLKEQYRRLSNAGLDEVLAQRFKDVTIDPQPVSRKQKLDALLKADEIVFKQKWQERYGWPFDDCYDQRKLDEHITRMQLKAKQEQEGK